VAAVLQQVEWKAHSSTAAGDALLQCLVSEVTPVLLCSTRGASVAASPALAAHAATSGSDAADAVLAKVSGSSTQLFTVLSEGVLHAGEFLQGVLHAGEFLQGVLHAGELLQASCGSFPQQACSVAFASVLPCCLDQCTRC
jgi:hypothetical protein